MKSSSILTFLLVLLISGCMSGITPDQMAASPTEMAVTADTPSPSQTATPIRTFTPTVIPSLTLTPTSTVTPTPTNTPTPTPLPIAGPATGDAKTRLGKGWVNDLTFSPNGKLLSVATSIGVYLYQLESMELFSFLPGNANVIDTVFVDEKTLVVGDSNGTTAVWDIGDKPKVLETLQRNDPVESLGVFDDGSILVVEVVMRVTKGGVNVIKWDRVNPEQVNKITNDYRYGFPVFSPEKNILALSHDPPQIILVDTKTMRATATICFDCYALALLEEGEILATVQRRDDKASIVLYDTTSREELTSFQPPGSPRAFSSDGSLLALTESDVLHLWDVATAELVNTFEGGAELVSFSPDNKMLASVSRDGKLIIRELPRGDMRLIVEGFLRLDNPVVKNGYFASIDIREDKIILSDIKTGETIRTFSPTEEILLGGFSIIFSADGNTIASTWLKRDYTVVIVLFDVLTGEQLTSLSGGPPLAFSLDGSLLAYSALLSGEAPNAGYSPDDFSLSYHSPETQQLMIWDIATGEPLQLNQILVPGTTYGPYTKSLVFSPDGTSIVTMSEPTILRDLLTGKPVMTLHSGLDPSLYMFDYLGEGPTGVFSPDGKILATTWLIKTRDNRFSSLQQPKGVIILWDVTNGEKIAILDGHANPTWGEFGQNPINALAFSPDGTLLASGAEDKTIVIWSVQKRSLIKVLEGHSARINSLSFSSDGKYLYSSSLDGTIITWDLEQLLP